MTAQEEFAAACAAVQNGLGSTDGIGTLSEKTLHATLKTFWESDTAFQEIPIEGYVADICREGQIVEIQTHDLGRLRDKLAVFTKAHDVTVVYPIAAHKRILLTDPQSGEVLRETRSPKHGDVCDAYLELLRLGDWLTHPRVTVQLVFLDLAEYRKVVPKSRKNHRGAECLDRIPEALVKTLPLGGKQRFSALLPEGLPSPFTAKDFTECIKRRGKTVTAGLKLLSDLGLIRRVGKQKNAYLYEVQ